MNVQDGHCPTDLGKVKPSYRPSWFVLLAGFVVLATIVRVAVGAPPTAFIVPLAGLAFTLLVDLVIQRD